MVSRLVHIRTCWVCHITMGIADQGDAAGARYCWQITYELTDDEDIKKMIDQPPQ